jgi:hypothetical protein
MFTRVAARTDRLPPAGPFLEVLQAIRRLLTRPEYFRLEREFAGPDFHRGEQCTFSRHTFQHCRTGHQTPDNNAKNALFAGSDEGASCCSSHHLLINPADFVDYRQAAGVVIGAH